ncbi:MAG: nucleotidyltransferase family protein [Sediminimonas qiaohouensis]|uniref:Nucleotidyltransferase family protein n=1 Tax=Sediminimonas qiaohouensis TaxID=552061 RepID=A0A7C9HAG2_9RHOB|nr:nucleotidyltransferase family protein [Sediminimonas qiaohouensis]MTJ04269.1 nucleotidyltransferase family protein [Sediminimonas qiaohouensis]
MTPILILAAGASRRMGGADKLLQSVAGQPLLEVIVGRACAAGRDVFVTLPGPDHPRAEVIEGTCARPVWVTDADEGMAASIRAGVAALPQGAPGVMILPADMPELTEADLRAALDAFEQAAPPRPILRATDEGGTPGHPVIFPSDLFAKLRCLAGDEGARGVVQAHNDRVALLPLPGGHATTDLDTPEAWASWRAGGGGEG